MAVRGSGAKILRRKVEVSKKAARDRVWLARGDPRYMSPPLGWLYEDEDIQFGVRKPSVDMVHMQSELCS